MITAQRIYFGQLLAGVMLFFAACVANAVPVTGGLVLHLKADSITGLQDGQPVAAWSDSSGHGNHAVIGSPTTNRPVYKTAALNGFSVVRFGADNSFLAFNEIADIRTVFWVCKEENAATGNRFLLGHSHAWDFHRGWHNLWDGYWASSRVVNGVTRLNGSVINGTITAIPQGRYSLISLVTTGNVRANQLTQDRTNPAAGWHGDIAEVLVYNRALTASQIADVEFYLNQKYFPAVDNAWHTMSSPDNRIVASVFIDNTNHLAMRLRKAGLTVLDDSLLGITVDGTDLGQDAAIEWDQTMQEVNYRYPWRGLKSEVVNHYKTASLPIICGLNGRAWTLECRLYNDGLAFRCRVPGSGTRTVNDEATEWVLPLGSSIWHQNETSHYEGYYSKSLPALIASGTPIGFPVTVELAENNGYAFITEAAVDHYSGMTLRASGTNRLVSTFENRTYYDSVITAPAFEITDDIVTPWRITAAVDTLNELVNCDLVHNVCPAPDPQYYPDGMDTEWIKPGKAGWNWWYDADPSDFELHKECIDEAAELNCSYYTADGGWWGMGADDPYRNEYDYLKLLCDYAAQKGIGIHVWAWLGSYRTAPDRAWFFGQLKEAGAVGIKFDFNNSESIESMKLYKETLLHAAANQLMLNFHGMIKPAGEPRTWPNEMTREGVIGLEWNLWDDIPPAHYATLPFTRLVAGHGDTTPCTLDPAYLRGTTYAFQIATAILHHSPLLHWADQPDLYLASDAVDMIRKIESSWDETLVLDGSQIGTLAAMAKRKGNEWFAGIINGSPTSPVQYTLDLSFLDGGQYAAHIVRDDPANPPELLVENAIVNAGQPLTVNLAAGGGFSANFSKLSMTPPGGWFVGSQAVSINSFYSDAEIRYTLDGSEPDANSPLYASSINLDASCLLRAAVISGEGAGHQIKGWFTIVPPASAPADIYLCDLDWAQASCGWQIPQKKLSVEGNPLRVAGNTYSRGIGTHADSRIVYDLLPGYARFTATAGIDDEIQLDKASVVFSVEIDGVVMAQSPVIRHGTGQYWHFDVPVPGHSRQLTIISNGTHDGIHSDHADWVDAGFVVGYDFSDLAAMAEYWLATDCTTTGDCLGMDLDSSGKVDLLDFEVLSQNW